MRSKVFAFLALTALATGAHAGPFSDDMAKCLVRSTSDSDKTLLIRWIFSAIATHPDVKELSNIPPAVSEQLNKDAGNLFAVLITERCKSETSQALKFEGSEVFRTSFEVLGQVAMEGMMTHADVSAYLAGLSKYLDPDALKKAMLGETPAK